jgi:hypothetical protein
MGRTTIGNLSGRVSVFFLFLIILLASAHAFDCNSISQTEECEYLQSIDESLIADLLYTSTFSPDHSFVDTYNSKISVSSPPNDIIPKSSGVIKNGWISILTVSPSVKYEDDIYVPNRITARTTFDYEIEVPENYYSNYKRSGRTCKILYSLYSQSKTIKLDGHNIETSSYNNLNINSDKTLKATLDVQATIKIREYEWDRYCCRRNEEGDCTRRCYDCDYEDTDYETSYLHVEDTFPVSYYDKNPSAEFEFISEYYGSSKGELQKDNQTNLKLDFTNSYYTEQDLEYSAYFTKEPYYFLNIEANDKDTSSYKNLIKNDYTFYVKDISECSLEYSNFFKSETAECSYDFKGEEVEEIQKTSFSESWTFLFKLVVFVFINTMIYKLIKKYWGLKFIPILFLLLIPSVMGAEDDSCGLTNLASCIPQKMYDFFIDLLNAPLQPLLSFTRSLLENPPSIEIFYGVWAIVVYCISLFYGLLFIYSGFQFIFSGHNALRRAMAKEWLKNTVLMIVLIQASFYLYGLVLEIGSVMTTAVLSKVNEHFFMITADNIINIGLEFFFLAFYVITLLITIVFLVIRYLIVCFGVLFIPVGIFCFFIPPLKGYGKMILNMLGVLIFITFLDAIIILGSSMLIAIPLFENIKIIVMISCFAIVNLLFIIMTFHVIVKSAFSGGSENMAQAVKYITMFL